MAQPIPLQLPPRDPKQELLAKLEQAPAEHAAALLDGYELLQQLHEHGVFTLVRGALGATNTLVKAASSGANSIDSIRAMRNAVIVAKTLGSIDPELLQSVANAVSTVLGNAKAVPSQPPGIVSLIAGLTSADQRRGLGLINELLRQIGIQSNPDRRAEAGQK